MGAVQLKGSITHIVFQNEENGYAVIRIASEEEGVCTVIGTIPAPHIGDTIIVTGVWVENKKFGKQCKAEHVEYIQPSTNDAIKTYLASGIIKGIGEKLAGRIVAYFGEQSLDIIDTYPEKLLAVQGISKTIVERIQESWTEQSTVRSIIMFLQPYGVSPKMAVRIFKTYGLDAIDIVKSNPYKLAMDIRGVGFITADAIAERFGFAKDSLVRAQAGILYMLSKCMEDGHIYYPKEKLIEKTEKELDIPRIRVEEGIQSLAQMKNTILLEEFGGEEGVFLVINHKYEKRIAYYIHRLCNSPRNIQFGDVEQTISDVLSISAISLSEEQQRAVKQATEHKVMVLTGGPGTGKTTITNCIISVFAQENAKILLTAPTGRAAKRISETTGREAKTIHRLLEYNPQEDAFQHNENAPLNCTLLVVDECSMIDTVLMFHLLQAVPLGATVLFVGDINQLPSVGAGNVLRDIIRSGIVPTVELTEIFRQAKESRIICNAHRIHNGEMPEIIHTQELSDFYFIPAVNPETVSTTVVEYVQKHIPRRFGLHPVKDIQVLTPITRGSTGVHALNALLQTTLNPKELYIERGSVRFHLDDKVMQIKNNYDKDVFNGDVGYICYIDTKEKELTIRFDNRNILYTFDELHEVMPAYAISIHKSQGSEYPAIVIPLTMQHYIMLQRNLVYTAITRGKRLVIVIGDPKALRIAVNNNAIVQRHTRLHARLQGMLY